MGCDIHLVVEEKIKSKWIAIDTMRGHRSRWTNEWSFPLATARNYERFAALAGVRGDGPEPIGLPSDMSETTLHLSESWSGDGHSHSWLMIKDASAIFLATEDIGKKDGAMLSQYPEYEFFGVSIEEPERVENYRIIFWFDN